MEKYFINYHTGAGNQTVNVYDLDEAKEMAQEGIRYTQENVTIEDESENVIAITRWYGIRPESWEHEEGLVLEEIGGGYYSMWEEQ